MVEFSDVLYNNDELSAALSRSLTDEGILVAQVGETNFITDPATEFSKAAVVQHQFMRHLQSNGFEKVTMFEEGGQANFMAPWQYMIAFKDQWSLENWFLNDAFVNIAIRDRILPTKNGESALKYFDGGTMQALQYPSRIDEDLFCRRIPTPELCENGHGFAPEKPNVPITSLEVRHSPIPGAGRGLFFKEAAPKGSYIAIDAGVHDLSIFPYTRRILREMLDEIHGDKWKMFETYVFGYGFAHEFYGEPGYSVDASIMTFINHGCNGTNNMGVATELTELTADLHNFPPELENSVLENFFYHPFAMRNHFIYQNAFDTLLRDVSADTELLDNYLGYLHSGNWEWGVLNYRSQCLQQGLGVVSDYETSRSTE